MIDGSALINPPEKPTKVFALGTVVEVYSDGITIKLDGDAVAGQKHYKRLASYSSPAVGHRVLVAYIGGSLLVIGNII